MTYKIAPEVALACELAERYGMPQDRWVAGRRLCLGNSYMGPCLRNGVIELVWIDAEHATTSEADVGEWMAIHTGMHGHAQRGETPTAALNALQGYLTRQASEKLSQALDVWRAL